MPAWKRNDHCERWRVKKHMNIKHGHRCSAQIYWQGKNKPQFFISAHTSQSLRHSPHHPLRRRGKRQRRGGRWTRRRRRRRRGRRRSGGRRRGRSKKSWRRPWRRLVPLLLSMLRQGGRRMKRVPPITGLHRHFSHQQNNSLISLTRLTREAMNQILKKLAIKSQENMKKSKDEMAR